MLRKNIQPATFTSVWDNGNFSFTSNCRVNLDTKEVFDIEPAEDAATEAISTLDREYITLNGKKHAVMPKEESHENYDGFWYKF